MGHQTEVLGSQEIQLGVRLETLPALCLDVDFLLNLTKRLIGFVNMTPDGRPFVRFYSTQKTSLFIKLKRWCRGFRTSKSLTGGNGIEITQYLVESRVHLTTWPDHGFLRIYLESCKFFDVVGTTIWLQSQVGKIQKMGHYRL